MTSERVTFGECVKMCASSPEFVAHLERLTGQTFAFTRLRAPLAARIDETTGRDAEEMARFVVLVDEIVWSRIPTGELDAR